MPSGRKCAYPVSPGWSDSRGECDPYDHLGVEKLPQGRPGRRHPGRRYRDACDGRGGTDAKWIFTQGLPRCVFPESCVLRREFKQLPIYALVMARKDGRPGPPLIESKRSGCTEPDPAKPLAVDPPKLCGNFELGPDGVTL